MAFDVFKAKGHGKGSWKMSIVEILNKFSQSLMNEGVTGDLIIHSAPLWEKARYEMAMLPYRSEPNFPTNGMIQFHTFTGRVFISKDDPEPSPYEIEKKVRDELNRRAMQRQKYSR